MIDTALGLLLKPLAFALASAPMVIVGLERDTITNRDNIVMLVAGLGMLVLAGTTGSQGLALPSLSWWPLVVVVPVVGQMRGWLGGGAAKLLIALLPWFDSGTYLGVIGIGMLAYHAVLRLAKPAHPISVSPTLCATGLLALIIPVIAVAV